MGTTGTSFSCYMSLIVFTSFVYLRIVISQRYIWLRDGELFCWLVSDLRQKLVTSKKWCQPSSLLQYRAGIRNNETSFCAFLRSSVVDL